MKPAQHPHPLLMFATAALFALLAWPAFAAAASGARTNPAEPPEYLIGPGDLIHIQVFQNPDLTLDTRVSERGIVTFPLIGAVQVGGTSLGDAERKIAAALERGGFVVNPQVTVALMQNRGNQVSVLGQVNRPGRFPLETFNTRLADVLAAAGGIASTGADTVILTGTRDGQSLRREIDVGNLFRDQPPEEDIRVASGDVVFVPRAPQFYIYGEVQRPGAYRLERGMTVRQAIAAGGGLTPRGTERGIRIQRGGAARQMAAQLNDPVQADDTIEIDESLF